MHTRPVTYLTETERLLVSRLVTITSQLPGVYQIYLFGSKVRGEVSEESDIDIAIFVDSDYDNDLIDTILNIASKILDETSTTGEIFLRPVLIFREDLIHNRPFVERIIKEGVILWEGRRSYQTFKTF